MSNAGHRNLRVALPRALLIRPCRALNLLGEGELGGGHP